MNEDTIDDCVSYNQTTLELFVPSSIIFNTLCVSTDKTSLFIISLIRLLMYIIIYYVLNDIMDFEENKIIQYLLIIIILVNILYTGVVVAKTPVFSIGADRSMFEKTEGPSRLLRRPQK